MKVNINLEITAKETRELLGLPNIQPLNDDILQSIRNNIQHGMFSFESFNQLFKPLLPAQFQSIEILQKFWEAVMKETVTKFSDKDNQSEFN